MAFSERTINALRHALKDAPAADEILSAITDLQDHTKETVSSSASLMPFKLPKQIVEYYDSPTIIFDGALSDWHSVVLRGKRILALKNISRFQELMIVLTQDESGKRRVTWFDGIIWPDGVEPVLSKETGKSDIFMFKQVTQDVYYGSIIGQNYQDTI